MSDDIVIRDLRALADPLIEAAIDTVAPNDGIVWDLCWVPNPSGLGPMLIFVVPAMVLNESITVGCMIMNPRDLMKQATVTEFCRGLVEQYREARAAVMNKMAKPG